MHYGVIGMRWGVHRSNPSVSGSLRRRVSSEDAHRSGSLRRKSLKELSNDDLKVINTRLMLERQYKSLKKRDVTAGEKAVHDVLQGVGKELAKDYVKQGLAHGISQANKWAVQNGYYDKLGKLLSELLRSARG